MTISGQAVEIGADKLMRFGFRAAREAGATVNTALVVVGSARVRGRCADRHVEAGRPR